MSESELDARVQGIIDCLMDDSEEPDELSIRSFRSAQRHNTDRLKDFGRVKRAIERVDPDHRFFRSIESCWESWRRLMRYASDLQGISDICIIGDGVAALDCFHISELSSMKRNSVYPFIFLPGLTGGPCPAAAAAAASCTSPPTSTYR